MYEQCLHVARLILFSYALKQHVVANDEFHLFERLLLALAEWHQCKAMRVMPTNGRMSYERYSLASS